MSRGHIVVRALDVRLLGPFQVLDAAGRILDLPGERPRALLALLALEAPNFVSVDRIVEAIWGDETVGGSGATLHVTMSRLRGTLGEDVIRTLSNGYRLELPVTNVDVERFRRQIRRGRQFMTLGHPGKATEAFRQALAHWRGSPLADLRRFEFAEQAAHILEEERLSAVEHLMEAELAAGNHALLVGELSGLVEAFPLRERLWELLMLALYRSGRQAEALRAFGRLGQVLGDELGVTPSKGLVELEERILLHDPVLDDLSELGDIEWLDEPELVTFAPGDVIVEQGALADVVYWIEEGRVEIIGTDDGGGDVVLAEMGPGRYFGELAALLGTGRTATVRALDPTTVSVHSVDSFRRRLGVERARDPVVLAPADEVRDLLRRGQYLQAYDLASGMVERSRADPELRYLSVLSLARSGATAQAVRRYEALGLASVDSGAVSPRLGEDIAALAARLDKDMAQADKPNRSRWTVRSAEAYQAAFDRHRSAYLGVNAATMWLMAGQRDRAVAAAQAALAARVDAPEATEDRYWDAASEAEAALVMGELGRASDALERAGRWSEGNSAARATTLKQLRQVCDLLEIDQALLLPILNPSVVHFCGHRAGVPGNPGRFPPEQEQRVALELGQALDRARAGFGFGSLAAGADIIAAEELLKRGAELQVVLPFDRGEFVRTSVAPAGDQWVRRFDRCLAEANGVVTAVTSEYLDDPVLFDFCARVAMGDAIVRARFLETDVHQIAVWDGQPTQEAAGTAVDVAHWRATGHPSTVIAVSGAPPEGHAPLTAKRQIRALVFGDFAGFSRLSDGQLAVFHEEVMSAIADKVNQFQPNFLCGNTWGDGLYLVFDDVPTAADCALALQELIREVDVDKAGLTGLRGMRIAAHAGPVFEGWDVISGKQTFFGTGVTQAARIEPRTPEGEVYVTHPFMALASLAGDRSFECQYVGTLPAAKGYGYFPLFALRRHMA
ncbi:MAG TPA: BTAD domain-containing putative transcriptional regulator [Acidimicrobiia bacterium]|nr:BTAD domain-containing putative transcriptional regulator [Acidimicrobiia bacterium]